MARALRTNTFTPLFVSVTEAIVGPKTALFFLLGVLSARASFCPRSVICRARTTGTIRRRATIEVSVTTGATRAIGTLWTLGSICSVKALPSLGSISAITIGAIRSIGAIRAVECPTRAIKLPTRTLRAWGTLPAGHLGTTFPTSFPLIVVTLACEELITSELTLERAVEHLDTHALSKTDGVEVLGLVGDDPRLGAGIVMLEALPDHSVEIFYGAWT
jgi:hypothetical protein